MMKRPRIRTIAVIFLFSLYCALAAQDGRILNAHETDLEWAYLDLIARGENLPTTVQSISVKEASFYGIGEKYASPEDGAASFRGRIGFQPFALGWNGLDTENRMTDSSILTRFSLEDPVIEFGAAFGSRGFFGNLQIDLVTDSTAKYAGQNGITGFWDPVAYASYWTFPEEGYFAWSDDNVTLAAGRLQTGIGLGKTNIMLNGQARWYDQIQFSWWSGRFRLFSFWGTSSSFLDGEEYAIQAYSAISDDEKAWGWDTVNNHDAATQTTVPLKLFSYHRVEFKPFARIGFGFTEMQLVGGKAPDLTNLLPTVFWHNTYSAGVSNVMLQADVWAVPLAGILVYGEFLMDDSKAPSETGAAKPNCWGWELGTTYVLPVGSRNWRYSLGAEYSHIDKWTYNRWQPYLTMYQRQMTTGGWNGFDIPLGHPEGGDVDQWSLTLTALSQDGKRIEFGYTYINKGPVYLGMMSNIKYPAPDASGPMYLPVYYDYDSLTGDPGSLAALLGTVRKHSHIVNLKAAWPLGRQWEANGEIDFRIILNAGHAAGETATETVYKTGFKWTYGK